MGLKHKIVVVKKGAKNILVIYLVHLLLLVTAPLSNGQNINLTKGGKSKLAYEFELKPVILNNNTDAISQEDELGADDIKGFVERGVYYMEQGQPDEALQAFDQAIGIYEQVALPWYYRGQVYLTLSLPRKARNDFKKALEYDNMLFEARLSLAAVDLMLGYLIEAREQLQICQKATPDLPQIYYLLGIAEIIEHDNFYGGGRSPFNPMYAQVSEQHMRARQFFKKAIKKDPRFAPAYLQLGLLSIDHQHAGDAVKFLKKSIEADSTFEEGYLKLAMLYVNLDKEQKAEATLQKLMDIDPGNGFYPFYMGYIKAQQGEAEEMVDYCIKGITLSPPDPDQNSTNAFEKNLLDFDHGIMVYSHYRDRYDSQTRKVLDKIMMNYLLVSSALVVSFDNIKQPLLSLVEQQPNNITALLFLGYINEWSLNYQAAVNYYDKVIALDNNIYIAYKNRGIIYLKNNMVKQAISDFTQLLRIEPQAILPYYFRASAKLVGKDYTGAILDLNNFLEQSNDVPEVLLLRGNCHELLAFYDKAKEDYMKVAELIPLDTNLLLSEAFTVAEIPKDLSKRIEALSGIARTSLVLGDTSQAKSIAHSLVKLDDGNTNANEIMAMISASKQDWQQAIEFYTKAIASLSGPYADDGYKSVLYKKRGKLYLITGLYEKAKQDFNKSIWLQSGWQNADAYYYRSVAYLFIGDKKKAIENKEKALNFGFNESDWDLPIPLPDWPE